MVHPIIRLRYDRGEERCVPAETVSIYRSFCVGIHAAFQEPSGDLDLIVVDTHVQERCSGQRCALRGQHFVMTAEVRRVDLFVRERALQELRITTQVCFEQIDASTMQRHYRRVRQLESVLYVKFEYL